jgi:hypothetical protein
MSLVQLVQKRNPDLVIDRLWLVFFSEAKDEPWWARAFTPPGYRHVAACAWFADQQRWVYYNPTRTGTVILLYRDDEFGGRFQQLLDSSALVLRVRSTMSRRATPFGWWCTGAIKALLGVNARALSPHSLARHLQRHGAEVIHMPGSEPEHHGEPLPT